MGFFTVGGQVQFLANPPAMTNGILPYAFVGPRHSNGRFRHAVHVRRNDLRFRLTPLTREFDWHSNATLNVAATGNQSTITSATVQLA